MSAVSRTSPTTLRGLLSVKYLITTPEKQEDFLAAADDGWSYYDTKDGFMLYENETTFHGFYLRLLYYGGVLRDDR